MLSIKTMRNIQRIQVVGNWAAVAPIKIHSTHLGIWSSSNLIFKGRFWKLFTFISILLRAILTCVGLLEVSSNHSLRPVEVAVLLMLIMLGFVSAGLQLITLLQSEEMNSMMTKFLRLNQDLCT